ncbi:TRAP transporter small permease [Acuticoccus sp. MNP-M23]|uniref:TRAP transporter small permease n=1 Tax=Acuticoccus sp. MNP-M23 TaxID=3072793 RepID=UPI0028161053|nr:TRAP transporter small permease [Acuticoccus sp. MNP-M23]WMS41440.1 TRAP transporter small permease [Acuticoccus sp. MNP-M23]
MMRNALLWLKRGADAVGVLLFLATFAGFIVQIFYRYVLNSPLAWTEEATMIAFIWAVFWAAAFMVPIREHVTFDVVYDVVPERVRRIFALVSMALIFVAFVILIPYTLDYLDFLLRKKSPVIRVRMTWVYGCYLLFVAGFVVQAGFRFYGLLRPNWREQI